MRRAVRLHEAGSFIMTRTGSAHTYATSDAKFNASMLCGQSTPVLSGKEVENLIAFIAMFVDLEVMRDTVAEKYPGKDSKTRKAANALYYAGKEMLTKTPPKSRM